MKRRSTAASTLLLGGLAVAVPVTGAAQTSAVRCADRLHASLRAAHGVPALAVAVRRGDALVYSAARGAAHIELGVPVTPSTVFQLSSTAKLFTGVLAMRLVEQGVVELDAPVTRWLEGAPRGWRRLTLRHLLSHVSGLPGVTDVRPALGPAPTREAILSELYRRAPRPAAGERWVYGRGGFLVGQVVLERAAGATFGELMRREVLEPAGMTTARYWRSHRDVVPGSATGYYPDSTTSPRRYVQREFRFPSYLRAAGGLAASVEDLLRFDRALRDGRLLPDSLRDAMWRDLELTDGSVVSYGIGWDTKTHAPGQPSAGHSGGYLTTYRTYPRSDLTAIALMNGFLRPVSPDRVATAFAAVWDPSILGLDASVCTAEELDGLPF